MWRIFCYCVNLLADSSSNRSWFKNYILDIFLRCATCPGCMQTWKSSMDQFASHSRESVHFFLCDSVSWTVGIFLMIPLEILQVGRSAWVVGFDIFLDLSVLLLDFFHFGKGVFSLFFCMFLPRSSSKKIIMYVLGFGLSSFYFIR